MCEEGREMQKETRSSVDKGLAQPNSGFSPWKLLKLTAWDFPIGNQITPVLISFLRDRASRREVMIAVNLTFANCWVAGITSSSVPGLSQV